jgi:hypothetical protein
VCGGGIKWGGRVDGRQYRGSSCGHVSRNAQAVDEFVTSRVLALLERDAPRLLRPQPRESDDSDELRAEARKLGRKRDDLARLLSEEILTEKGVRTERKRIDARLEEIAARLVSSAPDPLPEFRDLGPDANLLEVWDSLGIARQRVIVGLLFDVVILPAGAGRRKFDENTVRMIRKAV